MTNNLFIALKAAFISCFFVVIFYGLIFKIADYCGLIERYKQRKKKEIFLIGIFYIILTIYMCWLYNQGNSIPFWDQGFYWLKTLNFRDTLLSEAGSVVKYIYESVNLTDYSDVVPTIMTPFLYLGGGESYTAFRIQLLIMFQIPSYLIFADIINILLDKTQFGAMPFSYLISNIFCGCITFIYLPTLYGLFDVADFLVVACIILLLLCKDYCTFSLKFSIYLSSLFLMLLCIRRHFAFFALGYFLFFIITTFFYILWSKDKEKWKGFFKNSVVIGGVCLSILIIFFKSYLIRTLDNSYSVEYSARSYGSMLDKFITSFGVVGWLLIILSILGVVVLYKRGFKGFAIVQITSSIFIMWLFFRIQSLSCQHYYNFAGQIIILSGIGFFYICSIFKNNKVVVGLGLIFVLLQFMNGLVPGIKLNGLNLFSSVCYEPVYRNDINEIKKLVNDLNEYTYKTDKRIYCVCSSKIMNEDILLNVYLPEQRYAVENLTTTLHTDMAGGFPTDFLDAEYIVASSPAQIHANRDGQRIIWFLNDLLVKDSVFSDNYSIVNTYKLDDKVDIILYKKTKEFDDEDYEYLISSFDKWYADYPELFHNRIIKYEEERKGR